MKKFYIPTSIVYTNRSPHIGFALELVQADVLARYHRLLEEEVFFLTGTDEHGTKNVQAAKEAGKTPEDFTEEIARKVKSLKEVLNLSNDDFIRTSDKKRHWPTVKKIWLELKENGDIYKKKYKGLYCVGCEAFVKEKDLVDGKCPIHEKNPEVIEEKNYFFRLSKYQNQLKKIIRAEKIKIIPETRKNELLSFITQGLEDVSCSRSKERLEWGIPVSGDNTQTIYVWLEALANYLSALDYANNGDKFKKFWPPDVHCIGKDIFIRFHGSLWPAMLLSLKLELPKTIFVHGFITVAGQKMSKSLGNVVDPFELVKKYGTDAVRYFFLREIPATEDGDFTYDKFEQRYNADLANGLGNLVARVITLAKKSIIQNPKSKINPKFKTRIDKTRREYKKALEQFKFNEALISVWELISFCDRYIEKEKPWEEKSTQKGVISNLLFAVNNIAELLQPFLPGTSEKIFQQLKTRKSKPLFPRI
ncbi:MAG: methionine--tRNA ligase [Candidatus Nealsonbacteria bacterium CG02_land_8_20_14_3_00_37_10]|uniref:methionine--tRNA ligase n=2 Tax=Candidatus Nealsoniibacteriota TaxID=1817911 RepID=A0A2G9YY00_9BACT|nr:MAG: methionine--tRNA ligase [Candidatus Nealsonbacteria bacterium CG23_combo_of_CG06-09_8_20_14_all_37_18]PIV45313.1 MAG: methionine--tRNA ligase [Candidatus Nealsonbacteria bacterium CG02_land_8_20_14_3_00_37_10]